MIRNRDFAMLYAGRTVFNKNGEYAGVVVGWNDMLGVMLGVILGVSHEGLADLEPYRHRRVRGRVSIV